MIATKIKNIYPDRLDPYYIVTPAYERTSAGIKALHLLCHHLNLSGRASYLIITNREHIPDDADCIRHDLLTPILNIKTAKIHKKNNQTPIVIYPEIIKGNPLKAQRIIRYVLNFPGLLGGDTHYPPQELVYAYSGTLAKAAGCPENVLFIPTSDTSIFNPGNSSQSRKGTCFYASKYKNVHNGQLHETTKNSIEITRQPSNQTPEMIAEIFRNSEIFYTYENTALATEATLCGCPAVFLPNEYLESIIASEELGTDGYAWGNTPEAISIAKSSVKRAYQNYLNSINLFHDSLENLVKKSQRHLKEDYSNENYSILHTLLSRKNIHLIGEATDTSYEPDYAFIFKKLPWWIERSIGEMLCTLGFINDGEFLWERGNSRFVRSLNTNSYLTWTDRLPASLQYKLGKLFIKLGLERDGGFLIAKSLSSRNGK